MARLKIHASDGCDQSSRRGLGNTNDFGERQLENAERVNLSNGKMDGERCGRKKPAIIARICDGLLSIKKAHPK